MADTPFNARNGLVANGTFTANSSQFGLGNVTVTPSTLTVVTATGNVVINSSGVFVGNSTVNTTINSTSGSSIGVNTATSYAWTNTNSYSGVTNYNANVNYNSGTINQANCAVLSQTLTDAATINWNGALGQIATVTLGAAGRTMAAPTNLQVGTYILHVIQDATGSRTITTWNAVFKWVQATPPVLSTAANRHDIISFICDGTNMYGSYLPDVR